MYDMGMKVAAVSLMCQDERVWNAMRMAGTPCPFEGQLGDEALNAWDLNRDRMPEGAYDKEELENTLRSNRNVTYQTYSKEEFCATYPEEDICQ